MTFRLVGGDAIGAMQAMAENSVDAIVTDPPYGLEFMGKEWDRLVPENRRNKEWDGRRRDDGAEKWEPSVRDRGDGRPGGPGFSNAAHYKPNRKCLTCGLWQFDANPCKCAEPNLEYRVRAEAPTQALAMQNWHHAWATEALRILKPGGHLLAFGGTRTYHRLACAIEDAGFEIRDCIAWMYASGFPKSLNLDRLACQCQEGEYGDGRASQPEHGMRPVRGSDLPPTLHDADEPGQVLFEGVSEQGAPSNGKARPEPEAARGEQPSMEGRRDAQAQEGQLRGSDPRPSAGVGVADGPEGRLHRGASLGHGADVRTADDQNGSGGPHRPQPVEQRPEQPPTVADQPRSQDGGVWAVCPRCAQPRFPRGLGTALKPAFEPIVLARKPLSERNVAANVQRWGTGALNVDGCRIEFDGDADKASAKPGGKATAKSGALAGGTQGEAERTAFGTYVITDDELFWNNDDGWGSLNAAARFSASERETLSLPDTGRWILEPAAGRWPANVTLDETAAAMLDEQTGERTSGSRAAGGYGRLGGHGRYSTWDEGPMPAIEGDTGGASRFFYCPKADREERNRGLDGFAEARPDRDTGHTDGRQWDIPGSHSLPRANVHPTVKPVELMRWLCRMVTPKGGTVLDPFTGSGSTGVASMREGFEFIGIEREAEYVEIARARIIGDAPLFNVEALT